MLQLCKGERFLLFFLKFQAYTEKHSSKKLLGQIFFGGGKVQKKDCQTI